MGCSTGAQLSRAGRTDHDGAKGEHVNQQQQLVQQHLQSVSGSGETDPLGFICGHDTVCPLCGEACLIGASVYPLPRVRVEPLAVAGSGFHKSHPHPSVWVHLSCALDKGLGELTSDRDTRPVCKHWARKGTCRLGDRCYFRHPEAERGAEATQYSTARSWGGHRRKVRNGGRAWALCRFVVEEFGLADGGHPHGVLDIAGGTGEVAFLLSNLCGIKATVVDPRRPTLYRIVRKLLRGHFQRDPSAQVYLPKRRSREDRVVPIDWVQLYVDDDLLKALATAVAGPPDGQGAGAGVSNGVGGAGDSRSVESVQCIQEWLTDAAAQAARLTWSAKGLHEQEHARNHQDTQEQVDEKEEADPQKLEFEALAQASVRALTSTTGTGDSARAVIERLSQFSCAVGMHPDQATEFLVDLALLLDKPFAVVPCCVYASLFPHRRTAAGGPVTTYDQLLDYLQAKDPGIQRATLPFDGCNQVLYRHAHTEKEPQTSPK